MGAFRIPIIRASRVLAIFGGLAVAGSVASAQTFSGLGLPLLGTESKARDVCDSGVVVGMGFIPPDNGDPATGYRALCWTGAGLQNLGTLGGGPYWFSSSQGVSADGSVVVGGSSSADGQRAFRWTSAGGMVSLGTLPKNTSSSAHGVSSNGLVVVGKSTHPRNGDRAFRWTSTGGMASLGTLRHGSYSEAWAVSGDGSVVAGLSGSGNGDRAFRWTSSGMKDLGPALSRNNTRGDISSNGSVVVGTTGISYSDPITSDRACRWTVTSMLVLGTLQPGWGSWATGVNWDGSMVVGSSGSELAPGNARRAFFWTPALGMVDLNTYLPAIGIHLNGWTLVEADAISDDGTIIVGYGLNPDSQPEAWVVHLVP